MHKVATRLLQFVITLWLLYSFIIPLVRVGSILTKVCLYTAPHVVMCPCIVYMEIFEGCNIRGQFAERKILILEKNQWLNEIM